MLGMQHKMSMICLGLKIHSIWCPQSTTPTKSSPEPTSSCSTGGLAVGAKHTGSTFTCWAIRSVSEAGKALLHAESLRENRGVARVKSLKAAVLSDQRR